MNKKIFNIMLSVVLLANVLVACQSPAATPSQAPSVSQPTVEEVAEAETTEAPEAPAAPAAPAPSGGFKEVPREKTVIFENIEQREAQPENFNPYSLGSELSQGFWQANQESLFYLNYETGELVPWLATGYEANDDKTEYTIQLREGVKWSDGVPFTAEDIVFTINMLKTHSALNFYTDLNAWVQDVQAVDEHTVKFTLTGTKPNFIVAYFGVELLQPILIAPKHIWEDKDPETFTNYDLEKGWPLGTGAYRLVRASETENVWDRRDDWWGAETGFDDLPAPERLIWISTASEDVRKALAEKNELDAIFQLSKSSLESIQANNPKIVAWSTDSPYGYMDACARDLRVNNLRPHFDNADVRWAISKYINRDQLIQVAYEGASVPSQTLFPAYPWAVKFEEKNADLFEQYQVKEYNPAKADELMTKAGYTKDGGFWVDPADGSRLTMKILTPVEEPKEQKMMPVLQEQLTQAGFEVTFSSLEWAVYFEERSMGDWDLILSGLCGSATSPTKTLEMFHSRFVSPIGEPLPQGGAAVRFANEEYDKVVDQLVLYSPEDPEYDALARQAFEIYLREMPYIPLTQQPLITPFNTTYWTNWPTADNNYWYPLSFWWVSAAPIIHNIKPAE